MLGNQVGTIIGRKGTKITQIREESACEIKVKGNDQDVERIILVAGLPSGKFAFSLSVNFFNDQKRSHTSIVENRRICRGRSERWVDWAHD